MEDHKGKNKELMTHLLVEDTVHPYKMVLCTGEYYFINAENEPEPDVYNDYSFNEKDITCHCCLKVLLEEEG